MGLRAYPTLNKTERQIMDALSKRPEATCGLCGKVGRVISIQQYPSMFYYDPNSIYVAYGKCCGDTDRKLRIYKGDVVKQCARTAIGRV